MLIRFATTTFAASLLAGVLATGCTVTTSAGDDDGGTASLTIDNEESFSITDIYIDLSGWDTSDNILDGFGTLDPNTSITVTNFTCDTYDVEIIDTTGTDCYISDYALCGTNDEWVLTDSFFDGCASTEPRTPNPAPKGPITDAPSMATISR